MKLMYPGEKAMVYCFPKRLISKEEWIDQITKNIIVKDSAKITSDDDLYKETIICSCTEFIKTLYSFNYPISLRIECDARIYIFKVYRLTPTEIFNWWVSTN